MSAVVTVSQAQACIHAALADEVAAVGGVGSASVEVGVSDDTVRRWIAGSAGAWTAPAIAALSVAAHRRTGRALVLDRMAALFAGSATRGDGRRALADAAASTAAMLTASRQRVAAMADGRLSRAEAREALAQIPDLIHALEGEAADLADFLRSDRTEA